MGTKHLVIAAVVAGCSSREVSPPSGRKAGSQSRAECFATERVHDVRDRRRASIQVEVLALNANDRALIRETDFEGPPTSPVVIARRGYVWNGAPVTLKIPAGFSEIEVSDMNDNGVVVGSAANPGGRQPLQWNLAGDPIALPFEGHPLAINNLGHIAFIVTDPAALAIDRFADPHVWLYRDGAKSASATADRRT